MLWNRAQRKASHSSDQHKYSQIWWWHATGHIPQQVWEQLSLPQWRCQPKQSFWWWTQPWKSLTAACAWHLSLRLGEMAVFPGVLLLQSCAAKWRSYGKESASEMMREVDRIFSETLWLQEPQTPTAVETQVESDPSRMVSANSKVGEGWRLVTSGMKRKASAPPPAGLHLWNKFISLKAEEELGVLSSEASGPTDQELSRSTRRKWWVILWVNPCCGWQKTCLLTWPAI